MTTAMGAAIQRDHLGDLTLLSTGGQGSVYSASATRLLYKEYLKPQQVRGDRLAALVQMLQRMTPDDRTRVEQLTAFPQQLVYAGGSIVGFLMAEAPKAFYGHVGAHRRLLEVQYLTHPKKPVWDNLMIPDVAWKLRFLTTCARLFEVLHRYSLIVGDVSMRNLLWSPSGTPNAFLIDCDGTRIVGEEPAVPTAVTPDWDDPLAPLSASIDSDCYKLSLMILRVLTVVPAARPEDKGSPSLWAGFPQRLKDLMAIAAGASQNQRPTAARWVEALEDRGRIQLAPLVVRPPHARRIAPAVRPTIPLTSWKA